MKPLSLISLEGNWDAAVNAQRLEVAAAAFHQLNADFIISSGTRQPGIAQSDALRTTMLGRRNADALRDRYDVDPACIVPAYSFPFDFTYTTIEAFGNACVIGWLMSGFRRQADAVQVHFAPISLGAHCRRVQVLNVRACQALEQFNVVTSIREQENVLDGDDPAGVAHEESKLRELRRAGGPLDTGYWFHGTDRWCFDDPQLMRFTMTRMIHTLLPASPAEHLEKIVDTTSLAERYAVLQLICAAAAKARLDAGDIARITARTRRRFAGASPEASMEWFARSLASQD